ncbi:MAG: caspase family protein [Cyclobacteriaceae bacterium]
MKRILLYFFLLVFSFNLSAQTQFTDIVGEWVGLSFAGKKQFPITINLDQTGGVLSGTVYSHSLDNKVISHYQFNGAIVNNSVTIKGVKFIEKKGLTCLPTIILTLSEKDGVQYLNGKWKSNLVAGGCWPGFSGRVNLSKTKVEQPVQAVAAAPDPEYDELSQEIVDRLKSRKNYALIIGAAQYENEGVVQLDRPVDDAIALKDVLTAEYNFNEENVTLLTNPRRSQIIDAFDKLSDNVSETDNLLVFYAGHGIWDEKLQQGYWLPVDAKKDSKAQWLSNGTIRDYLGAIDSKHTLLIADACFSGGILKERAAFNTSRAMVELYKLPSRKAITSGTLKTVPDQSVFLKYLIEGLKNNDHAIVSAHQLFANLRVAVIHNSPNSQVPQYGVIFGSGDQGGDFLFVRSK